MFQKKIIDKYLSKIEKDVLSQKYELFCSIFANEEKQANIRESKEEQYQEGFIRDLFCSCLGYTIKPEANYNILTELKNESKSNAKKSDGAIVLEGVVKAVIELKGTDTQDLDRVAFQAFSYKNHHENCPYVIVSNFERLRVYVETQIEFVEFNLFSLTKEKFDLLFLLLSIESIKNDIPLKLKHETLTEEKEITNSFYTDYSAFKRDLFDDLCNNNTELDKLTLFKKTQKLLDRILFILFCEDRGLLPANSTIGIIGDFKKLKELGYYQSLYSVLKTFFSRIDKGFKSESDSTRDVFAYNGGLFKTDEILDSVIISDDVLLKHCKILADYDFQSQISVDILGRIFENSLTEIEELTSPPNPLSESTRGNAKDSPRLLGEGQGARLSKRKKDGVFYTPEYITKYIVENTIGTLCEAKKTELNINDKAYTFDKKYSQKTVADLDRRLEEYRAWLLSLKILDPACGSGAFLNAALKFLRKEHTLIDYFWSKIHSGELNFTAIDNAILENNLYGVDINEDSVEITKLSLWLSTAQKNRKLTTLAGKIKCGNSLISDKNVAGEKAFDWKNEFPEVFGENLFSKSQLSQEKSENLFSKTPLSQENRENLFSKSPLSQENRENLFSKSPLSQENSENLNSKSSLSQENGENLFSNGFDVIIGNPPYVRRTALDDKQKLGIEQKYFSAYKQYDLYVLFNELAINLVKKNGYIGFIQPNKFLSADYGLHIKNYISHNCTVESVKNVSLDNVFSDASVYPYIFIYRKISANRNFEIQDVRLLDIAKKLEGFEDNSYSKAVIEKINSKSKLLKDIASSIKRGIPNTKISFVEHSDIGAIKSTFLSSPYALCEERLYINYLNDVDKKAKCEEFSKNLILLPRTVLSIRAIKHDCKSHILDRIYYFSANPEFDINFLLCILNSKIMTYFYNCVYGSTKIGGGYIDLKGSQIENFPIPAISREEQKPFVEWADKMLNLNADVQKKTNEFLTVLKAEFALKKISTKLQSFYALSAEEFVKELKDITPKQKMEWISVFSEYKADIAALTEQIEATDKAINAAVYALYGLSAEEISAIEG